MSKDAATLEEIQIARMAREFRGEIFAAGATLLSEIAARMAKLLYDDDLILFGGGSFGAFDCDVLPMVGNEEYFTRNSARGQIDWTMMFDLLAADRFRIFTGPVQIDRTGNANLAAIGDWERPDVQLIGSRGLPDDLWRISTIHFHVPAHTRRSVVDKVDFVSSFGFGETRERYGCKTGIPGVLVTNLGVFGWSPATGAMTVESLHPGISAIEVRDNTGFDIDIPADVPTTRLPTPDELDAIRNLIDPFGLRAGGTIQPAVREASRRIAEALLTTRTNARSALR